ncbi:MAG TPA: FAD-dependent oxidoreductase, partial [Rhodospirillales bacterium]|nr:FAD-dependent oxidoreductase [Rhodospirillales bacterium]
EAALPPHRIVKEKRATFAQTPAEAARRPGARTGHANLFLAGDWTDTGLPATLEGSVRSGNTAAEAVANMLSSP